MSGGSAGLGNATQRSDKARTETSPAPLSLFGKLKKCVADMREGYFAYQKRLQEELTEIAREEEEKREALLRAQRIVYEKEPIKKITGTLNDLIDVCRSRVKAGKVERARRLLEDNDLDVNGHSKYYGDWTPTIAAARSGHIPCLKFLVSEGADVNASDKHGWTPLMFAAKAGNLTVVEYLVEEAGADRQLEDKHKGYTALMWARDEGHHDIVSFLRGDTPARTPRNPEYGLKDDFSSLRSYLHRLPPRLKPGSSGEKVCWCQKLTVRCKKCRRKIDVVVEARRSQERRLWLEAQRKKKVDDY